MKNELLRMESIKKSNVLKWLQLQIFEQEIVHCVFDNVQAKYMFLDIISGKIRADYGKFYYQETVLPEKEIPTVLKKNVAIVSNESSLIGSVSILENMFIIRRGVKGQWTRSSEYRRRALELFDEFDIPIDLNTPTGRLSPFEKVQIEIIKAYLLEKKVLIITALNNAISDREAQNLWSLLNKMKMHGFACIVAEPMEDINFRCTDRVVIIKNGKTCAVKNIDECEYTMLHTIIYQSSIRRSDERDILSVEVEHRRYIRFINVSTEYLKDVSLTIEKGQVVKLFCVDEKSYEEITGVLKGKIIVHAGQIQLNNKQYDLKKNINGLKDGIGVLDGNPVSESLFMELTAMDNLQMLLSHKVNGIYMKYKYKKSIRLMLKDIISADALKKRMKDLSNSDIQKIAYCKWLIYSPDLLVCIQPFADGDIKAREAAREMIYMLESRKIPILIITGNSLEFNYCRGKEIYMSHGEVISKEDAAIW